MYYIYGIEETTSADKTSITLCGIEYKQLHFETLLLMRLLLLRGLPNHEAL